VSQALCKGNNPWPARIRLDGWEDEEEDERRRHQERTGEKGSMGKSKDIGVAKGRAHLILISQTHWILGIQEPWGAFRGREDYTPRAAVPADRTGRLTLDEGPS
jgi:hypothetical protein